jgi:hypothetical protein
VAHRLAPSGGILRCSARYGPVLFPLDYLGDQQANQGQDYAATNAPNRQLQPVKPSVEHLLHCVKPITGVLLHCVKPITGVLLHCVKPITGVLLHCVKPITGVLLHCVKPAQYLPLTFLQGFHPGLQHRQPGIV